MVLGAVLIALTPAVFMFLFSFELMNRSIDRWFSPNTSELREDSNRVVLELAQYVTNNARVEAESIAATRCARPATPPRFRTSSAPTASPSPADSPSSTTKTCSPRQLSGAAGIQPGQPASVAQ